MTIDLSNPIVAQYFSATNDPNVWQCKKTGFLLGHGILKFYCSFGGNALCGLTHLGLPLSSETPVAGHDGVVYQRFERGVLAYDPGKAVDSPPQAGDVYVMHIDSGVGQDPHIADLQNQVASLQQSALAQELQKEQSKLEQIAKIIGS